MTQVFPHGGAEIMPLEKGTFKVNTQQLKPYYGGEIHANKQTISLSVPEPLPSESSSPRTSGPLRSREVELSTLNNVLLGRQPKLFEPFLSVV